MTIIILIIILRERTLINQHVTTARMAERQVRMVGIESEGKVAYRVGLSQRKGTLRVGFAIKR